MSYYAEHRRDIVNWVRSQLIGPVTKEDILRGISPIDRYPTGVLYPVSKGEEGIDPSAEYQDDEEEQMFSGAEAEEQTIESAIKRRRYTPPSSVGFSFFVQGEPVELQIICNAVRYEQFGKEVARGVVHDDKGWFSNDWRRIQMADSNGEAKMFSAPAPQPNTASRKPVRNRVDVFGNRAGIDVLWRPFKDGWITTVSLYNKKELPVEGDPKAFNTVRTANSLFEVKLRCVVDAGEVGAYPRMDKSLLTDEEQELELQYMHRHIYAVGHGAAVTWEKKQEDNKAHVAEIRTEFLPAVEVPKITADVAAMDNRTLQLVYLASVSENEKVIYDDLDRFVAGYAAWVEGQKSAASSVQPDEKPTADRIVDRMERLVGRMKHGVSLLRRDARAAQSFAIANQAMLDQMMQYDRIRQDKAKPPTDYRWRPFQLAFLLSVIESVVNEESDYRDTVDLIWFPTGGGKTEAYLGLIAFLIVWRRLTNEASGGGTTVLMRYTLRLLTAQQYKRANRMICALELIRRKAPALSKEPITVGMWVGAATSPNTFRAAQLIVEKAANGKGTAPMELVLDSCPWCETSFKVPANYRCSPTQFHFQCTNPDCEYGQTDGGIVPCNVVDEALYNEPPTLLIATIDKFARLAWEERANVFFGKNGSRPPELVIQDELHLIAGALGSVAGLYEAALETVLVQRGIHPKYVASTATIRMADQQVRLLYGKAVAIFPPPGLSCDDSYFARTVSLSDEPGRLYIGYLAPMLDRLHCMAPLAAALLLAPGVIFRDKEHQNELMEAWWTQVVYHGSLKGVGNSHNSFNIDVREFLRRYSREVEEEAKNDAGESEPILRPPPRIAQLTSLSRAEDNARTFARLEKSRKDPECLDAVLATNMISVGLDVARLALMIVNGQPLTTAEYIQASSRVGRGDVPGLVFANYYRDQARSLSHYENFRPYHETFYRFVEPTSVTPYTYQTRVRALHAALVIAVRHSCTDLLPNNRAGHFDPADVRTAKIIETLKRRCRGADQGRASETEYHIDKLVNEWKTEAQMCKKAKRRLDYQAHDKEKVTDRLLHNHDDKIKGRWPTLQSMRNVENTALLKSL